VHLDRTARHLRGGMGESLLMTQGRRDAKTQSGDREAALFADAGLRRDAGGALLLGGVPVEDIAREAGTPAYVYNAGAIRAAYGTLRAALDRLAPLETRIHYAVKANGSLAVLKVLRDLGAGCDIVSVGELRRALAAGFAAERIVFSGVGKTPSELCDACAAGIGQINVESLEELEALGRIAESSARPVAVGIRVNPDVTVDTHPYIITGTAAAKFGIPADLVVETAREIAGHPRLELSGIAMHVGSQLLDADPYLKGATRLAELVGAIRAAGIASLRSLDLGGGLGIRYDDETPLDPADLVEAIRPVVASLGLTLHVEPGRYLVGSAGLLLATALYRKHSGGTDFLVVDAGMNDLVRPSHYQAHHEIVVARDRGRAATPMDVVGPICETGDFLALGRPLPEVDQGDVVAILGAGAYGFVMGSTYNARVRPPEILVDGGRWAVARPRETLDHLLEGEVADPFRATGAAPMRESA
jgi:diaminopimelate decarboxylase